MTAHAEAVREAVKLLRSKQLVEEHYGTPESVAMWKNAADRLESTLAPSPVVPSLLQRVLEREHETSPVVPPPRFKHDCERCVFLGRFGGAEADPRVADLYWCAERTLGPTLIARWSDDGPDYSSGIVFAPNIPAIGEAKRLAEFKGLPLSAPAAGTAEPDGWACEEHGTSRVKCCDDAKPWTLDYAAVANPVARAVLMRDGKVLAERVEGQPWPVAPGYKADLYARAPRSTGPTSRTVAGWPDETLNAFCADGHVAVWYNANSMGDEERCPVCLAKDAAAPSSGAPEVTR